MIGRATYYGVCAGGETGALRALEILKEEFVRTMQLCGTRSVAEIKTELLVRQGELP
jgi:(S)-mandelate dehydrogenase